MVLPVSLLMIDIDFFKKVNDTYGHQAGDTVLAGVAMLINEKLRGTDLIARYGGEEFCLLATGTEQPGAEILAERMRKLIEDAEFEHGADHIKVTISIGIGTWESRSRKISRRSSVVPMQRFTGRKNKGGTGPVLETAPACGFMRRKTRYCFSYAVDYYPPDWLIYLSTLKACIEK